MPVTWAPPGPPGWQVLDVTGHDLADLAAARRWTEARLEALGEAHRVDAVLVAGELLDNAYRHADGPLQLRLHQVEDPCEVTVAVTDHGDGVPRMRAPANDGGRGLLLVDRLCRAWGITDGDGGDDGSSSGGGGGGKTVWGRISCPDS
jgi:two-component sensor histidine kinase